MVSFRGVVVGAFGLVGLSTGAALAGGDCNAAGPAFAAAVATNTAQAMVDYLNVYAPCLEVPARARLAALGGAPAAEPPAPAPPPPPPAPPARVADASCTTYANARSERWDQPMDFRVTNRTDMTLSVAWINYDGVRQSVGSIDPGASFGGGTYVTHPFEFTGPDGACVMIVMPQMGVTDYYIGR